MLGALGYAQTARPYWGRQAERAILELMNDNDLGRPTAPTFPLVQHWTKMEDMNEPFISSKTASKIVHMLTLVSEATKTSLKLLGVLRISHLVTRADMERGGKGAKTYQGSRGEAVGIASLGELARSRLAASGARTGGATIAVAAIGAATSGTTTVARAGTTSGASVTVAVAAAN